MKPDEKSQRDAVNATAAEWVVRLAVGSCSEDERATLDAWLKADPAHEVAFERESLAWERTERLRALRPQEGLAGFEGLAPPGRPRPARRRSPSLRRWKSPARVAAAVALTLGAAGAAAVWTGGSSKAYATAIGERRVVVLTDGSRVELNTDTRLEVRMTPIGRRARLLKGEALFEVNPDRQRSFVVAAKDDEVRSERAAAFNVRVSPQAVKVLVVDGAVEVRGRTGPDGERFSSRLSAGALGVYGPAGPSARTTTTGETERALSWRYGAIVLSGEKLSEAAAEFNRYNAKRLVVADPAIADLRLGGYFKQRDVEGFARALESSFDVKATDTGRAIYLSRAVSARRAPAS